MKTIVKKLKKEHDPKDPEILEKVQSYVVAMELRGFRVIVLDHIGKEVDII